MIRITKLHVLLILMLLAGMVGFWYQIMEEKQRLVQLAASLDDRKRQIEEDRRLLEDRTRKQELAIQAVAVAGEYRIIARHNSQDTTEGEKILRAAKNELRNDRYVAAWEKAHESIRIFKNAKRKRRMYVVQPGDSLWGIAAMPRHYRDGSKWPVIWNANKRNVVNPRLIYPRQKLVIPWREGR